LISCTSFDAVGCVNELLKLHLRVQNVVTVDGTLLCLLNEWKFFVAFICRLCIAMRNESFAVMQHNGQCKLGCFHTLLRSCVLNIELGVLLHIVPSYVVL